MNSRSIFRNWFGRNVRRRAGTSTHQVQITASEWLEARTNPTGNVTAQLVGQSLYLYGDEAANGVELTASGNNLVLRGLNNTTINGQATDFLVRTGNLTVQQSLYAFMGGGDDTLALTHGAQVRRDAYIYLGEGNDAFAINASAVQRHFQLDLGGGADAVSLDSAVISGQARISGGLGDKFIGINNSTLSRTLTIATSTGSDNVVIDSSTIGDDVVIATSLGDDSVVVDNSKLLDYATIDTSLGDDFVQISPTTIISDNSYFFLGAGNDNVVFDGANSFRDEVNVYGQSGIDNVESSAANSFRRGLKNNDTDGSTVDDSLQMARIAATSTGAVSRADALRAALATTLTPRALQVTLNQSAIGETAGANAATGTVTRPVGTVGAIVVTLASSATDEATVPTSVIIPAGQNSVSFLVAAIDDTIQDGNVEVTLTASAKGFANGTAKITVEDSEVEIALELDTSANQMIDANGTLITKASTFSVSGKSVAGATVEVDVDGDGFDDGTQTADGSGAFSMIVPLTHTDTNHGANTLRFRATTTANTTGTTRQIDVHRAIGSVVEFAANLGTIHVELLDSDAPLTVANFKNYFSRYTNAIIHRSVEDFVIQSGAFTASKGDVTEITTDAGISNEFRAENSNLRGTLSMAFPGTQQNAGTSQWFINAVDNSFLDSHRHTVFGRVIGDGMDIVDTINSLPTHNLNAQLNNSALGEVPLIGSVAFENISGTVSVAAGSTTLTGVGTNFFTDLRAKANLVAGTTIKTGDQTFTVASIQSNTQLTLSAAATNAATGARLQRQADPGQQNYILFSRIGEVLNTI